MKGASSAEGVLGLRKDIDFAERDLVGARASQEDYSVFWVGPRGTQLLAVLADGMGGHAGGEVASKMAVDSFVATFNDFPAGSVLARLGAALQQANSSLATGVSNDPALDGMGCTLVGLHIDAQGLQWVSVGDSPLFLYRNRQLSRLNADHSMRSGIQESLRRGRITNDEASSHPNRNVLRSALTGESMALIDTSNVSNMLCGGDVVVLASDGLLTLSEKQIAAILRECTGATAERMAGTLIAAVEAKKLRGQDNTTVQVVIVPTPLRVSWLATKTRWRAAALFVVVAVAVASSYWAYQQIGDLWSSQKTPSTKTDPPEQVTPRAVPMPAELPAAPAAATQIKVPETKDGAPSAKHESGATSSGRNAEHGKPDLAGEKTKPMTPLNPTAIEQVPASKGYRSGSRESERATQSAPTRGSIGGKTDKGSVERN